MTATPKLDKVAEKIAQGDNSILCGYTLWALCKGVDPARLLVPNAPIGYRASPVTNIGRRARLLASRQYCGGGKAKTYKL